MTKKTNIVLFDMDNTLVLADTINLWADFLDAKGFMTEKDREKQRQFDEDYKENRLDVVASFEFALTVLNRIPQDKRDAWREECFQTLIKPEISSIGLRLIDAYKQQPDTLVILSTATNEFLAAPVAQYAGVHALIATEEEMHGGQFTGKIVGVPNLGEGKVIKFQHWLELQQLTAAHTVFYSDSINDLPLLSEVKTPIVVDPDHRLKAIAIQNGWEIMSFKMADHTIQAIDFTATIYA